MFQGAAVVARAGRAARRMVSPRIKSAAKSSRKSREAWLGVAFALPALLLLVLFRYWPLVFGMWMSLWKWGFVPEDFVALGNYQRILTQDLWFHDPIQGWQPGAIGNGLLVTVYYALATIPAGLLLAFGVAYPLFYWRRGRTLLRILFFLPYITSQVAAALVFKWIFHPIVGLANAFLERVGLPRQEWFTDPDPLLAKLAAAAGIAWPEHIPLVFGGPTLALCVIIVFSIWSSLGFQVVIFLSGLSQIPGELTEAARIDGARTWHVIRHVTLPLLSPTWYMLLIVSVIGAFESFNAFYVFSSGEGGPMNSTMSLPLYIFRSFYVNGQVGYASAVSIVLFLLLLCLTWLQMRVGEKRVHYLH